MNEFKDNFIQLRDELALSSEERSLMRAELERISMPHTSAVLSPFLFFTGPMRYASAFVVLVLATLGGSSAIASGALPGDTLYSVKIHLNENVERTLAQTPEAKANVDIKHAEERLSEVELLAAKGDASPEDLDNAAAAVAANVASATDTAHDLVEAGNEAGADGISAHIASALMAHADILDAQADTLDNPSEGQDLRALSFAVSATADTADESQDEYARVTEDGPAVTEAVALNRQSDVKELMEKLSDGLDKDGVPAETHDGLLAELAAIETGYGAALDLVATNEYADAGAAFEKLQQRAYRALALLYSAKRINEATGQDVVITLDDSTASGKERSMMKAAPTLAAPMMLQSQNAQASDTATDTLVLRKGNSGSGNTLEFKVRARSWNP